MLGYHFTVTFHGQVHIGSVKAHCGWPSCCESSFAHKRMASFQHLPVAPAGLPSTGLYLWNQSLGPQCWFPCAAMPGFDVGPGYPDWGLYASAYTRSRLSSP